jgi:hypothetical protein
MLLVMLAVAAAGTLAVTFLSRQQATTGVGYNVTHHPSARAMAETGIDAALRYIKTTDDWRDPANNRHDAWTKHSSLDEGRFKIKFKDPEDQDLDDNDTDPVIITAHGEHGRVSHRVRVRVDISNAGQKQLLLIARRSNPPGQYDAARRALFEQWGYDVTVMEANASKQRYQQATSNADLVYISERVSSNRVQRHGIIRDLAKGVVNEEAYLNDAFGLSQKNGPGDYGRSIQITDPTHYITQPFDKGDLTLTQTIQDLRRHPGPIAQGAEGLARQSGGGELTLAVFHTGDQTHQGSAPGRRVFLPFGDNGFRVTGLTSEGRTLLKRSLKWAAGGSSSASQYAAATTGDIRIQHKDSLVDSFRSSQGKYNSLTAGDSARLATNSTASNAIKILAGATLAGDAFAGPGGDPKRVIHARSGTIDGSKDSLSEAASITTPAHNITKPTTGSLEMEGGTRTYGQPGSTRTFHLSDIELKDDTNLIINGPVRALVDGDVEVSDRARIQIQGSGSLKLYIKGDFEAKQHASINTSNAVPSDFRLYMLNGGSVEMRGKPGGRQKNNTNGGGGLVNLLGNGANNQPSRAGSGSGRGGHHNSQGLGHQIAPGKGHTKHGGNHNTGGTNAGQNGAGNSRESTRVYGLIVAPGSEGEIKKNAQLFGGFQGRSLEVKNGGQLHHDLDAGAASNTTDPTSPTGNGQRTYTVTWLGP